MQSCINDVTFMMVENKLQTSGVIQKQVGHIRALHPKISLRSSEMWFSEQMGQHKAEHTTINDTTVQHNDDTQLKI